MVKKVAGLAKDLAAAKAKKAMAAAKFSLIQVRELLRVVLPALVLALGAFVIALRFVEPPPPRAIVVATGAETSAYNLFGKRYADALAKSGITVTTRTTLGSIENVRLLKDPAANVDAALVQGGVLAGADNSALKSIGRLFLEPMWVFYRADTDWQTFRELKGRRVAVGPEGGGTRALVLQLLTANGIDDRNASFSTATGLAGADALERGEIDALFLVTAIEAQSVQRLLRAPGIKLMSLAQADAYTKRFPFLTRVTLPRGAVDLVADEPKADVQMVAAGAALVVRETLHPAIVTLLAEAAQDLHGRAGLFQSARQFPQTPDPELDVSPFAERHYKQGQSFLRRLVPFWLASFMERMAILIIPILTVVIPAIRIVPALYSWQIKRRLHFWYGRLKELESRIQPDDGSTERMAMTGELDEIEQAVSVVPVPLAYAEQFYTLRAHIELVRSRLASTFRPASPAAALT